MPSNRDLHTANQAKKDEFYTQLSDIEKEMRNYKTKFRGTTVLCNCDDPFESNFFKYFAMNFNTLGLKKLIATCYSGSPIMGTELSLFDEQDPRDLKTPYKIEINEVRDENNDGAIDLADVKILIKNKKNVLTFLEGNGDFRSEECIKILKKANIVVTNPPFSLFREYVAQLIKYNKKFIIIGNVNAITYKEIFPLIKENLIWLGQSIHSGDREFQVPASYPLKASGCRTDEHGNKFIRVKGVRWFTNLDYKQRHEELVLYKHYYGNEKEYPKYDNYDAININKTADIPCDYFENIGVPITYLDKYNPEQFTIVKFRKGNDKKDLTYTIKPCDTVSNFELRTSNFELRTSNFELRTSKFEVRKENYAVLQNYHQTQDVMESWEFPLRSSINIYQNNLKLSETNMISILKKEEVISEERECIVESSSRERCNGIMGVPITFIDKYNPDQFEILGLTSGRNEFEKEAWPTKRYDEPKQINADGTKSNGSKANTRATLLLHSKPTNKIYYIAKNANGPMEILYARILIKKK